MGVLKKEQWHAVAYLVTNLVSGTSIVFANKLVLSTLGFHYVYALTFLHSVVTMLGMWAFAATNMFKVLPLAAAFVGYVVLWNLSLQLNPVGFYQLAKIAITPAVLAIEAVFYAKRPTRLELTAVGILCVGITLATVTDDQVGTNVAGLVAALSAILCTAVYQIWVGAKQKELGTGSMQLMHQFQPHATVLLVLLVVALEPLGLPHTPRAFEEDTIMGYKYTPLAVGAILITAVLGLVVSLSTFLVIGATSSVTFNVVGHMKTVIILAGSFLLFEEPMPPKKFVGIMMGMSGIVWYSYLKMTVEPAAAAAGNEAAQPLIGGDKDVDLSSADVSLPAKHLPSAASLTGSGHAQLSARFPSVDAKH